ncbi:MAG: hypothetical protein KatS3mg129_3144 [Leptospiraceae bacterium]|nr:MAG: hypothetical protein KatS3mg129_3144 [Leptospiraceae bacterium]
MRYHFKPYKILLLIFDALILFFTFYFAYYFKLNKYPLKNELYLLFLFIGLCLFIFYLLDLYNPWSPFSKFPMYYRSLLGILIFSIIYLLFSFLFLSYKNPIFESRTVFIISILLLTPVFFLTRFYFYKLFDPDRLKIRWLMITNLEYALEFQKEIERRGGKWEIYYLLDKKSMKKAKNIKHLNIIGEIETEFEDVVKSNWTGIIIAIKKLESKHINTLIEIKREGIPIYDLVYFYEYYFFKIPLFYIDDSWFLFTRGFMIIESSSIIRIKYLMDKILSILLIILFLPIMILVTIAIWIDDGFPILFKQERLGLDKKIFIAYKFRTMIKDADKYNPYTQENDPRITRIGKFLRKSRLDELPQLFNILKGDMSLIGPRAEWIKLTAIYEKEIKYYHFRHLIRPGLTGWAQIMYPYGASIEDTIQKLEYDLYYIKNYSFLLDFSIIIKTARIMLFGRGR